MKKSHVCTIGGLLLLIATVVTAIHTAKHEEVEPEEETEESIFKKIVRKANTYKFVIILTIATGVTFAFSVHHFAYQAGCAITAYKILKRDYDAYLSSAKEVLPAKKETEVRSSAVKKLMGDAHIVNVSDGKTLLYEPVSRTYYEGSIGDVQAAEKQINDDFSNPDGHKCFYSYREFLDMLGLHEVHLRDSDPNVEQNIGFYKYDGPITISYHVTVMPDDKRCVCLIYDLVPRYDFDW